MKALEARLTRLEQAHAFVYLKSMTADELDLHIKTLTPGAPGNISAVIALINLRGSAFPVVHDDPRVGRGRRFQSFDRGGAASQRVSSCEDWSDAQLSGRTIVSTDSRVVIKLDAQAFHQNFSRSRGARLSTNGGKDA